MLNVRNKRYAYAFNKTDASGILNYTFLNVQTK